MYVPRGHPGTASLSLKRVELLRTCYLIAPFDEVTASEPMLVVV